jgi:hypothetical protein
VPHIEPDGIVELATANTQQVSHFAKSPALTAKLEEPVYQCESEAQDNFKEADL